MSNTVRIGNQSISYEQAKDMLFPELIPQKGNEALLSVHPHDKVEDLAVLYRLDLYSGDGTMMSARVTQGLLDAFGVSAEQMKKDALEHAPVTHPASFRSMEEVLSEMMGGMPVPTPDDGQPRLYVASTETMNRGAGVLAYPDFLQEASEKIGGNFFILPSSIHELLFLKDTGDITRQELTSMVRSVNAARSARPSSCPIMSITMTARTGCLSWQRNTKPEKRNGRRRNRLFSERWARQRKRRKTIRQK